MFAARAWPRFEAAPFRSPRYGQHLDIDRISQIVQAPESEIKAVTSWLDANKIGYKLSKTRHVVEAEAPVAAVEALLNCELFLFQNKEEPERAMVRKMGPMYLPHHVAGVVRAVFNVVGKRQHFCIFDLATHRVADPPLSRKGRVSPKPNAGSSSERPSNAEEKLHAEAIFLPYEPSSARARLVSVQGTAFYPGLVYEPSPTAPLQASASLQICRADCFPDLIH